MKLRRPDAPVDLGSLPLDAEDAYLLSRFEQSVLTVEEVADLSQGTLDEVQLRIERLLAMGLLTTGDEGRCADPDIITLPELSLEPDSEPALALEEWPCPPEDLKSEHTFMLQDEEPLGEAPFVADPPSTLMSLLRRGPLEVDIYSVPDAPDARAPRESDMFPKVETAGLRVETFEELVARKRNRPKSG